jgi:5-phospho-D-xylono-1,4-lactonase
MIIQTVLGQIKSEKMGVTDCHDHLIRSGGLEVLLKGSDYLLDDLEKAILELNFFSNAGGKTIIEMGSINQGRDIEKLLTIAKKVPVNIVAATGFFTSEFYDKNTHWVMKYSIDQIAKLMIEDITKGIDYYDYTGPIVRRSEAKAGVIKVGTSYGTITEFEKRVIHAAAIAQAETHVAISTHTQIGTMGIEQVELLKKFGANPEKIIIGHLQRNPDIWYHKKVADSGASLMYDGGFRAKYASDSSRMNLIKEMVDSGYQRQIVLGVDAGHASYQKAYGGGAGIDYDVSVFIPRMCEEGISNSVINDITINNPARLFSIIAE